MGQKKTRKGTNGRASNSRKRFTRYFPVLFAYLRAMTGNEASARDATASAFEATLPEATDDEHEFVVSLFTAARALGRSEVVTNDGLDEVEREVISLTFDAQLTRPQVAQVLGTAEDTVVMALLSGLRTLRDKTPAGAMTSTTSGLPAWR